MEKRIFNTASEVSEHVAELILSLVKGKPDATLGLATGRTMDAIYHHLVKKAVQDKVDFSRVKAFAVDEYVGLAVDSPNSFSAYLDLHLFNQLNFKRSNIFIPQTHDLENIDQLCSEYEQKIAECGGIDLQLLGLGLNGHIGLNEPGSAIDSRTRVVALTGQTRQSNRSLFRNEAFPLTAVTMGIGTILESKCCLLVVTGETKAQIVQKLVNGDIHSKLPATALKQHANITMIMDNQASKLL
ncbi:MAG: glucosamine-6-phosphate deaminase [Bacteriovoracaceae bacterium]|jgi:glucosamine-6-phosphate deaminase|nr:glucosamine-6-phosphate deaminase [Bacteriovoracaceae bacterium]|tara:strand:+ start:100 stop:825 length:726 start_codon:yes stop_codon:yes gene_type:complete